jgi:DNA polymerase-3 subunit epsilon
MKIQLTNPLAVFDLETTGVDVSNDRIVEIAILKVEIDGSTSEYLKRVNPQMPIPNVTSEIHGIYDKDIADAPIFDALADEIAAFIGTADLAGYNSNKFDIPVLAEEFLRANHSFDVSDRKFVDVQNIFHKMEQRTLVAAYSFYCNKELINAHSAMSDASATWEVLKSQIEKYDSLTPNVDFLSTFSKHGNHEILDFAGRIAKNDKGQAIYNFGKHNGKTVRDVAKSEPGYYGWMLDANFPLYTKQVLKKEMEKIKKENEQFKEKKQEVEKQQFDSKLDQLKNKFK